MVEEADYVVVSTEPTEQLEVNKQQSYDNDLFDDLLKVLATFNSVLAIIIFLIWAAMIKIIFFNNDSSCKIVNNYVIWELRRP